MSNGLNRRVSRALLLFSALFFLSLSLYALFSLPYLLTYFLFFYFFLWCNTHSFTAFIYLSRFSLSSTILASYFKPRRFLSFPPFLCYMRALKLKFARTVFSASMSFENFEIKIQFNFCTMWLKFPLIHLSVIYF